MVIFLINSISYFFKQTFLKVLNDRKCMDLIHNIMIDYIIINVKITYLYSNNSF